MTFSLPVPDVVAGDNVNSRGVQSNFEALALAVPPKAQSVPTGAILPFGGTTAPVGFLLCNGGSYSAAQYLALFNVIGYSFGGSAGSFLVPSLVGGSINAVTLRFIIKI